MSNISSPPSRKKASQVLYFTIWRKIATYLDDCDVISLAHVSVDTLDACDCDEIWAPILQDLVDVSEAMVAGGFAELEKNRQQQREANEKKLLEDPTQEVAIPQTANDLAIPARLTRSQRRAVRQRLANYNNQNNIINNNNNNNNDDDENENENDGEDDGSTNVMKRKRQDFIPTTYCYIREQTAAVIFGRQIQALVIEFDEQSLRISGSGRQRAMTANPYFNPHKDLVAKIVKAIFPPSNQVATENGDEENNDNDDDNHNKNEFDVINCDTFYSITETVPLRCPAFQKYFAIRLSRMCPQTMSVLMRRNTKNTDNKKSNNNNRAPRQQQSNNLNLLSPFFPDDHNENSNNAGSWSSFFISEFSLFYISFFGLDDAFFPVFVKQDEAIWKLKEKLAAVLNTNNYNASSSTAIPPEEFERLLSWKIFLKNAINDEMKKQQQKQANGTNKNEEDSADVNQQQQQQQQCSVNNNATFQMTELRQFHAQTSLLLDSVPWLFAPLYKLSKLLRQECRLYCILEPSNGAAGSKAIVMTLSFVFSIAVIFGASAAEIVRYGVWPSLFEPWVAPVWNAIMPSQGIFASLSALFSVVKSKGSDIFYFLDSHLSIWATTHQGMEELTSMISIAFRTLFPGTTLLVDIGELIRNYVPIIGSYFFDAATNNNNNNNETTSNNNTLNASTMCDILPEGYTSKIVNGSTLIFPPEETTWQKIRKGADVTAFPKYEHTGIYMVSRWPNDLPMTREEQDHFLASTTSSLLVPLATWTTLFAIGIYTSRLSRGYLHRIRCFIKDGNNNDNNNIPNHHQPEKKSETVSLKTRFLRLIFGKSQTEKLFGRHLLITRIIISRHAAQTFFHTFLLVTFLPLEWCIHMPSDYFPVAYVPYAIAESNWFQFFSNFIWQYLVGEPVNAGDKIFYTEAAARDVFSGWAQGSTMPVNSGGVDAGDLMMTVIRGGCMRFGFAAIVLHQLFCWGVMSLCEPVGRMMDYNEIDNKEFNNSVSTKAGRILRDEDDEADLQCTTSKTVDDTENPFGMKPINPKLLPRRMKYFHVRENDLITEFDVDVGFEEESENGLAAELPIDHSSKNNNNNNGANNFASLVQRKFYRLFERIILQKGPERNPLIQRQSEMMNPLGNNHRAEPLITLREVAKIVSVWTRTLRTHWRKLFCGWCYFTSYLLLGFGVRYFMYRREGWGSKLLAVGVTVGIRFVGAVIGCILDLKSI